MPKCPIRFVLPVALVTLAAATPVRAQQATSPLTSCEVLMSTVMQKDQSSFSGLGVRARLSSPVLPTHFVMMPGIEYWRNSTRLSPYEIEGTRKDATVAFDLCYEFPASTVRPYLGAGLGIHFLSSRVNAPSFGLNDETDSVIKGGAAILGGVDIPLTEKVNNLLEFKYHHLSDYRQFKINWGIGYRF